MGNKRNYIQPQKQTKAKKKEGTVISVRNNING